MLTLAGETSVGPGGRPGLGLATPRLEVVGVEGCPDDGGSRIAQLKLRAWQPCPPQALTLLMVH